MMMHGTHGECLGGGLGWRLHVSLKCVQAFGSGKFPDLGGLVSRRACQVYAVVRELDGHHSHGVACPPIQNQMTPLSRSRKYRKKIRNL